MKEMPMDVSATKRREKRAAAPTIELEAGRVLKAPPAFIATRLAEWLGRSDKPICYIARNEEEADGIAQTISALFPAIDHVVLPPWDCPPYDRAPPSRHSMGRRMDALRLWTNETSAQRLLLTSLEALLQRVPPLHVIAQAHFELAVGKTLDRDAFIDFAVRHGYSEEGVADDPGEFALHEDVIDVYPAGAPGPLRIVLGENNEVLELHGFDRISQRTESSLENVSIGPASEVVWATENCEDTRLSARNIEHLLLSHYDVMASVFDLIGDADLILGQGMHTRIERCLEIIADAYQGSADLDETNTSPRRSLYLSREEWDQEVDRFKTQTLDLEGGSGLPVRTYEANYGRLATKFAREALQQEKKVLVAGEGKSAETFYRRLENAAKFKTDSFVQWSDLLEAKPGSLLKSSCLLQEGFCDQSLNIVVIAAPGGSSAENPNDLLSEPELRIGDVVVHEDHGIEVLKELETIIVEDVPRDAARLEYRDGDSILVPMQEFDKLWRYGSEPDAVSLDRLHTEAWSKRRQKIAEDIAFTARHLSKVAKERRELEAEKFVPPRAQFTAFTRRFRFVETRDQASAIRDVLSDFGSGRVTNRLVCGDVGFGKTEVALRAAAAVALCGAQVVVIAPTTVLARQHFHTFEQRFRGTGISVGMLSRLLKPAEAKQTKAALAGGKLGVIVATQAIFAKDVRFAKLGLLIVDEEHRFGLREKRAMTKLAPSLHTLMMSATPIPRTLQSAMVGVQEVSLLTTAPSKRRAVRTSITAVDNASIRAGLMREHRRGGQSFVVVPRIEDIDAIQRLLETAVPELSVKVAHGKMPAALIDETVVSFAAGDGDILLATNIIENGLDIPRANTMFIFNPERFGLAQLHQLRGRVGRSGAQGHVTLLTDEHAELDDDTSSRLTALIEGDRLGSGLAISLRDLDLRGGGDMAGDDQAGHMRVLGVGFYQKLLAAAVADLTKRPPPFLQRTVLQLDASGTIPEAYVADPATRLNLYAKLSRASDLSAVDDLEAEFEDRFGEPPPQVLLLLRTTRLQLTAARLGFSRLEAGPKALALNVTAKAPAKAIALLVKEFAGRRTEDRIIFEIASHNSDERLKYFEDFLSQAGKALRQRPENRTRLSRKHVA